MPNDVEIVVAFLATQRLGAIWVGLNRALAGPEKHHMLADSGVSVLLADQETCAQLDGCPPLPALHARVQAGGMDAEWASRMRPAGGLPPA